MVSEPQKAVINDNYGLILELLGNKKYKLLLFGAES